MLTTKLSHDMTKPTERVITREDLDQRGHRPHRCAFILHRTFHDGCVGLGDYAIEYSCLRSPDQPCHAIKINSIKKYKYKSAGLLMYL